MNIERITVPFAWEFSDPEMFARSLASTGPAFEAIEHVGEPAFVDAALDVARAQMRADLPLRAEIDVVGYLARKPGHEEVER
ncbi:MAG: Methyltransferase type 11 [Acidimicrobiales bacterium]|nr:Methyltransferase type 11 [Acidimicrobiales bacterium]